MFIIMQLNNFKKIIIMQMNDVFSKFQHYCAFARDGKDCNLFCLHTKLRIDVTS